MQLRWSLLVLTLTLTARDAVYAGRIFGGKEAKPHSRPYMALVERNIPNGTKYCGGFLLRDDFVMTAAHCDASSYNVILGVHDFKQEVNTQKISVKQAFPNTKYDKNTYRNDLLLLQLNSTAKTNDYVSVIAMAGPEDANPTACSVAGWGYSEHSGLNLENVLMEVDITLESCGHEDADRYFYCCKGDRGIGPGDSGGPLVCDEKVYGVVTAKLEVGDILHLFSEITNHKEWIEETINSV